MPPCIVGVALVGTRSMSRSNGPVWAKTGPATNNARMSGIARTSRSRRFTPGFSATLRSPKKPSALHEGLRVQDLDLLRIDRQLLRGDRGVHREHVLRLRRRVVDRARRPRA